MEETLVSEETAKLAFKAGFKVKRNLRTLRTVMPMDETPVLKPTQSILQKWLKTHKNVILTLYFQTYWKYRVFMVGKGLTIEGYSVTKTREEALEKGLQMALRLISLV
jgi:hypothetical protein